MERRARHVRPHEIANAFVRVNQVTIDLIAGHIRCRGQKRKRNGRIVSSLLGFTWVLSATSILAAFGAMLALYEFHDRRRRRQFLEARLPRAYLPSKT